MRHQVRIEVQTSTQDAAGQRVEYWTTVAERRAAIERTPGSEVWASAQRHGLVPTVFRLRYMDGVSPGMRLIYDERVFDILSAIDPAGRGEELIISAEEKVGEVVGPPVALAGEDTFMTVTSTFTTLDPVESTFPVTVSLAAGTVPVGVQVARVENLTSPSAAQYAPVFAHWTPLTNAIRLDFVSGLEPAVQYRLTLEILE